MRACAAAAAPPSSHTAVWGCRSVKRIRVRVMVGVQSLRFLEFRV